MTSFGGATPGDPDPPKLIFPWPQTKVPVFSRLTDA